MTFVLNSKLKFRLEYSMNKKSKCMSSQKLNTLQGCFYKGIKTYLISKLRKTKNQGMQRFKLQMNLVYSIK